MYLQVGGNATHKLDLPSLPYWFLYLRIHVGFHKSGVPQNGMENILKLDDLGEPLFQETSIDTYIYILNCILHTFYLIVSWCMMYVVDWTWINSSSVLITFSTKGNDSITTNQGLLQNNDKTMLHTWYKRGSGIEHGPTPKQCWNPCWLIIIWVCIVRSVSQSSTTMLHCWLTLRSNQFWTLLNRWYFIPIFWIQFGWF